MPLLLIILFYVVGGLAQHAEQPIKEETSDLRSQSVLFSAEDLNQKKLLWLERTVNLDYFLRFKDKGEEQILKLASREGARLDREFASRFLKCQYELASNPGDCKVVYRLGMKGEGQEICEKDDKKTQEVQPFLTELEKRFSAIK